LAQIIENIGYNVSDVTDVIHTHLHVDHCGGSFKFNTNGFEPVFPKANYWLSAQQLENALNPTSWEEPSFQPQVIKAFKEYHLTRWIDKSQYILPWLQCRLYYGHTPGLIVPIIFDTECKHVFCSDLIPTTEHLTLQCISAYDINPSLVFEEKKLLHEEVNRGGYSLIFQHEE
jgi:glyoxylase-like metal-dependent hydrolase (beta-lactamase superfamily II)